MLSQKNFETAFSFLFLNKAKCVNLFAVCSDFDMIHATNESANIPISTNSRYFQATLLNDLSKLIAKDHGCWAVNRLT